LALAQTRIALLRLSETDPRDRLLQLAENPKEGERVRSGALAALREYHISPVAARVLKLYTTERDEWVRCGCIWLLRDLELKGITEAMTEHVLDLEKEREWWVCGFALLDTLNHRLQTSFRSFSDLKAHLRKYHSAER